MPGTLRTESRSCCLGLEVEGGDQGQRGQGNIMSVETVLCLDYGGGRLNIFIIKYIYVFIIHHTRHTQLGNFIMLCLNKVKKKMLA